MTVHITALPRVGIPLASEVRPERSCFEERSRRDYAGIISMYCICRFQILWGLRISLFKLEDSSKGSIPTLWNGSRTWVGSPFHGYLSTELNRLDVGWWKGVRISSSCRHFVPCLYLEGVFFHLFHFSQMLESSGLIVAGLLLAHTLYHKRSPLHNSAFLGQEEERKMQTMMMYQLGQDWFQALTNNLRLLYASVDIICGNDVPNISILSRPRRCAVWKCMLIGLSYGGGMWRGMRYRGLPHIRLQCRLSMHHCHFDAWHVTGSC